MTKKNCEKIITKYYNEGWKESYLYMIWNSMKNGQILQLPGFDIMKNGLSYNIKITHKES